MLADRELLGALRRRDDTYVEPGMPHSDKMRVIERWTQIQPDTLEIDVTLIDPVMLTGPAATLQPPNPDAPQKPTDGNQGNRSREK